MVARIYRNRYIRKLVFNALAAAGYPMLMFSPVSASLEDIFIKLTAENDGTPAVK